MFLGQPYYIGIKVDNFDLKDSETEVAGIFFFILCTEIIENISFIKVVPIYSETIW